MRMRTIGMLVVAVLLAGLAAHLVEARLDAPVRVAAKAPPAPSVLVATRNLTPGEFLHVGDLRWQTWPRATLASNYVVKGHAHRHAFVGRVMRVPIAAGEPVTDAESAAPGDHGFLAAVLKPGMRAVAVAITATSGLHGMVSPGDRVDLVLTESLAAAHSSMVRHAGLTILRNVRVLAINRDLDPADWKSGLATRLDKNRQRQASGQQTATLEVTPKEVQTVAVAEAMGRLSLSLRSLGRAAAVPASARLAARDPARDTMADKAGLRLAALDPPARSRSIATKTSYTLDSTVSPLLPRFPTPGQASGQQPNGSPAVTILRGDAEAVAPSAPSAAPAPATAAANGGATP